jgi:integrase
LDLKTGWLDFERTKTGVARRVPLWPETVDALNEAMAVRRSPKDNKDATHIFLNRSGRRLIQTTEKSHHDSVSIWFRTVLRNLGINGRVGLNFYSLRHTIASVGLQAGDRDAVRAIMGHVENDMLSQYDELGVADDRLRRVTEYVRNWLLCDSSPKSGRKKPR